MEYFSGSLIYNIIKDIAKFRGKYLLTNEKRTISNLESHITWAEGWSRQIQMFGMNKAVAVEQQAISLSISDRPRKFSCRITEDSSPTFFDENDILGSSTNYVILGDPGCGKTTLCKRLTRSLILSEPNEVVEVFNAPIVILGRELHSGLSISSRLCDIFGIEFKALDESKLRDGLNQIDDREEFNNKLKMAREQWMQKVYAEADILLFKTLGKGGFVLIIDGIDEINANYRDQFEHDLQALVLSCPNLKVLSTCRAGDWNRSVITADLLSIEPLNSEEVGEIVNAWAEKPQEFLDEIEKVPYREILDRPLFLTLLLIIFNQGYKLPDCPIDVYERITSLLVERWDRERDIFRETRFAAFLSEKKLRFISSLAFELTFKHNVKRFSVRSLRNAYEVLAARFKLPNAEFTQVLQEIESHTGIIIESGFESYEFCHLTVQEFLAAKHLVGLANPGKMLELLSISPATIAVATSASADPSNFLATLLDQFCGEQSRQITRKNFDGIESFVNYVWRIQLELPEFSQNNAAAIGMLKLWQLATQLHELDIFRANQISEAAILLSRFDAIRDSVNTILERDNVLQSTKEGIDLLVIQTMGVQYRFAKSFVTLMAIPRD